MASPTPDEPRRTPDRDELSRQRLIITFVIGLLLFMAVLALTVVPRLGLPLRIFVAASDVVLAAVLWVVLRQKFGPRP